MEEQPRKASLSPFKHVQTMDNDYIEAEVGCRRPKGGFWVTVEMREKAMQRPGLLQGR